MLDKYEAQFQIDVLQRLDEIIRLLKQLEGSLPMTVIVQDDLSLDEIDWDNNEEWR